MFMVYQIIFSQTKKIPSSSNKYFLRCKVQVGVINELGSKIEKHLRNLELNMASMSRTEASRCRATHVKLTRDFRTIETKFKKLQLETRRKRDFIEAQRRDKEDENKRRNEQEQFGQEAMRYQLQMQEDHLAEEIMREREDEIRNINRGMHQVNEIYKDLANIVGSQQADIENIEKTMEESKVSAESGLAHVTKANQAQSDSCVIS